MRVTRKKQLRTHNKETTNAKSLQQIFILTRKYMLHSILRSLFESLVRVSLPSSPRARASRLPFFFEKSRRRERFVCCRRFGTGGFEFLRWHEWISLSLSDSHSTTEEFNLTRHPRLQILSLSLEQKSFLFVVCDRDLRRKQCACMKHFFFNPSKGKSPPSCAFWFARALVSRYLLIWFFVLFLVKNTRKNRKEEQTTNKKHIIKRHNYTLKEKKWNVKCSRRRPGRRKTCVRWRWKEKCLLGTRTSFWTWNIAAYFIS